MRKAELNTRKETIANSYNKNLLLHLDEHTILLKTIFHIVLCRYSMSPEDTENIIL